MIVAQQTDSPALKRTLDSIWRIVVVRVVPDFAVDHAATGYTANVDRDHRLGKHQWIVPIDARNVCYRRAVGQVRIDNRPETQNDGLARVERTVIRKIVRRQSGAGKTNPTCEAVHGRRLIDVGQVARIRLIQVVSERNIERRHGADVLHSHCVFKRCAGDRRTTIDNGHFFDDRELLRITNDYDGWLRSRRRIAIAVRE